MRKEKRIRTVRSALASGLSLILAVSCIGTSFPVSAQTTDRNSLTKHVETDANIRTPDKRMTVAYQTYQKGAQIRGTFSAKEGYDIATIRYYTDAQKKSYAFAAVSYDENAKEYTYSFSSPYDGFSISESAEYVNGEVASDSATVIAEYFSTTKWDGAVDVSWYNETDQTFHLSTPAQLAGFAAIVNGSTDVSCKDYYIKGDTSVIACATRENATLVANVKGKLREGLAEHDFSNRKIILDADMDMGGVDGSKIDHTGYNDEKNHYSYPNWTPVGGQYLMDVDDPTTMIEAHFNGTLDGNGHHIENLYCYRWAYPQEGITAYGYAQGTGFIGMMGVLSKEEKTPDIMPAIRNLSVSGYVYGRRMVGGIVGAVGGGSNAVSGDSVTDGVQLENLANHAYVYNTDSKGIGGIVGCSMAAGAIINCYNDGAISTNYANPAGGIIGADEHMDIYCCYNVGTVKTGTARFGRGIGGLGNSPGNFTVNNCYYLNGCGDDPTYPGFYTYNLPASTSVTVTGMTETEMTNGSLLNLLNVNGKAYVEGNHGYPVLYWEKQAGTGSVTLKQPEGGSVTATIQGELANGTVVYLAHEAQTGYNFRYYTRNGAALSGNYVTVNGASEISAYMESAKAGVLKLPASGLVDISVGKSGYVNIDGTLTAVTDYPVKAGDELYENDVLTVRATLKDSVVPEDESLDYKAAVGKENAYEYFFTYTNTNTTQNTNGGTSGDDTAGKTGQVNPNFTVGSEIAKDGVTLTVEVKPLTCEKVWSNLADTSWYNEKDTSFTLTTAAQLAGLDRLVENGNSFAGKTIRLGNDISLTNTDGTKGIRYWDGIGNNSQTGYFAGTFDGQGYAIRQYHGLERALFAQCKGEKGALASVKNVSVYGNGTGTGAAAIVSTGKYTRIENCNSYVVIKDSMDYSAGILAYDNGGCEVRKCVNYASLDGKKSTAGIVGYLSSTGIVRQAVNYGAVTVKTTDNNQVGGIVGNCNGGSLEECANYGDITASGRNIGGVVGEMLSKASATDCYNVGAVTYTKGGNSADALGGLIGFGSSYQLENCFQYGNTIRESGTMTANVGSLIGRDMRNSSSTKTNVFVKTLAHTDGYVSDSKALSELKALSAQFYAGVSEKKASEFATTEFLNQINDNLSFVLNNKKYPELTMIQKSHIHTGGTATCSRQAVCDTCGLSYGSLDPDRHEETEIRNQKDPVWVYDGYTGDIYCTACKKKIAKGSTIAADKTAQALKLTITAPGRKDKSIVYTKEKFDQLKTTDPAIAYGYGADSKTMMAATEYVTLNAILKARNIDPESVESITVICTSSTDVIPMQTLKDCCYYFDPDGKRMDAPAALAIAYSSQSGTLEQVAACSQVSDDLRFGYGISQKQYEDQEAVGGKRCVSPVKELKINLYQQPPSTLKGDVDLDGELSAADVTAIAEHVKGLAKLSDTQALSNADTNGDGQITMEDADYLSQHLARIVQMIPETEDYDFGNASKPNIKITQSPGVVHAGDEFTVTLGTSVMQVSTFTGGISYDPDLVEIEKISTTHAELTEERKSDLENPNQLQLTIAENPAEHVAGIFSVGTTEIAYQPTELVMITFKAKAGGNAVFTLYEDSDGKDGCQDSDIAGTSVQIEETHDLIETIVPATAKTAGTITRTCSGCDYTEEETIPMISRMILSTDSYTYTGNAYKPAATIKDASGSVIGSENYSVTYSNNTNAGTAKAIVTFKGKRYSGTMEQTFAIKAKTLPAAVSLKTKSCPYTGKAQTPAVTVKDGKKTLKKNVDYTVSYAAGRKNVGTYKVTVKGKGNYSGSRSTSFTILPKGTSLSKVTAKSKAFVAKWKKQSAQTTGYQIRYAANVKLSKAKTVTIKKNSVTSVTVKKLSAKKKYYIQIRTYKKAGNKIYYSGWSKTKSVTTKK